MEIEPSRVIPGIFFASQNSGAYLRLERTNLGGKESDDLQALFSSADIDQESMKACQIVVDHLQRTFDIERLSSGPVVEITPSLPGSGTDGVYGSADEAEQCGF